MAKVQFKTKRGFVSFKVAKTAQKGKKKAIATPKRKAWRKKDGSPEAETEME